MNKLELEKIFYIEKNYSKIKEILNESFDSWSFNMLAKIYLEEGNIYLSEIYFEKAGNNCGIAYCKLLQRDFVVAEILARTFKETSSFVNWLVVLIEILTGRYQNIPTYFQIRNFYEQDLEFLFKYKLGDCAKKLILSNDYLYNFNREIYKYTARVCFNNTFYADAELFIKKSLDVCYNDPESHFILGELYRLNGLEEKAKQEYYKSIEVCGGYAPAEQKIKLLTN